MAYHYRILIPANSQDFNHRIKEDTASVVPPDVSIDVQNIERGSPDIQSRVDWAVNTPYIMRLAQETASEGYDGILISDFDMCGVDPSRELVDIPVIGGFRANALTACMIAQRFSIVTILERIVAFQRQHVRRFDLGNDCVSVRPTDLPVTELSDVDTVVTQVFEQSQRAIKEDGAEAIILGCTGFIGIADKVYGLLKEAGLPAPVLDPNRVAISFLDLLVRNGLAQSRMSYPPVKEYPQQ